MRIVRRWSVRSAIVALAMVAVVLGVSAAQRSEPSGPEVAAWLKVNLPASGAEDEAPSDSAQPLDRLCREHQALITSPVVCQAAVEDLMSQAPTLVAGHPDGINWLEPSIRVTVKAPGILTITMPDEPSRKVQAQVVNAVATAYLQVSKVWANQQRTHRRDILKDQLDEVRGELTHNRRSVREGNNANANAEQIAGSRDNIAALEATHYRLLMALYRLEREVLAVEDVFRISEAHP